MADIATQQSKSFWLDHIQQWQQSALSQAAYCRQHDLCQQKFSYHKRKAITVDDKVNIVPSPGFARVQVDSSIAAGSSTGLSLRLIDGACIEGISEHNLILLKPLLAALS